MSISGESFPAIGVRDNYSVNSRFTLYRRKPLSDCLKSIGVVCILIALIGLIVSLAIGLHIPLVIGAVSLGAVGIVFLIVSRIVLKTIVTEISRHELELFEKSKSYATSVLRKSEEDTDTEEREGVRLIETLTPQPVSDSETSQENLIASLSYNLLRLYDVGVFLNHRTLNGELNIAGLCAFLSMASASQLFDLMISQTFVKGFLITSHNVDYKPLTQLLLSKVSLLAEEEKQALLGSARRMRSLYGPMLVSDNNVLLNVLFVLNIDITDTVGPAGSIWDYVVMNENLHFLTLLLSKPDYLSCCDKQRNTVLTSLIEKGRFDLFSFVLSRNGNLVLDKKIV
ncbi:MAG: hypothetical protein RR733_03975 [Victivallaceae bacterium]